MNVPHTHEITLLSNATSSPSPKVQASLLHVDLPQCYVAMSRLPLDSENRFVRRLDWLNISTNLGFQFTPAEVIVAVKNLEISKAIDPDGIAYT